MAGITSTAVLYDLAKKLNLKIQYIGFAEDLHNQKLKKGIYIINLGDLVRGGSHWTLLYIGKRSAFYSDSYAMPPEDGVIKFVSSMPFDWNKDFQLQGVDENYCGEWSLLTARHLKYGSSSLKKRFEDFAKKFNNLKS